MLESCDPFLRESRSKGKPSLGSGAIYPVDEDLITIDSLDIKPWWTRGYGMDVGWNFTAIVWFATDPDTQITYLYDCYKREKGEPAVHADAVRQRGAWMRGVIDPASSGRSQVDGRALLSEYRSRGLRLLPADNAVTSGIYKVWSMLSNGQLKIFRPTMGPWLDEYRIYRRDSKGKIIKENDHLMDATRYAMASGLKVAKATPAKSKGITSGGARYYGV